MPASARERIVRLLEDLQATDPEMTSDDQAMPMRVEFSGIAMESDLSASEAEMSCILTDLTADEESDGEPLPRRRLKQGTNSGYLLERIEGDYRAKISELELKLAEAARDRAAAEVSYDQELTERDKEIESLRGQLDGELKQLLERQAKVEAAAPAMTSQLRAVRQQLSSLSITEAQYMQILQTPREQRPLVDDVKVAVYEAQREMRMELDELQGSIASAREASARAAQDVARLRRENARLGASVVEREKDADGQVGSLQARCERLAVELEDATVRAEVLAAKGRMYDDLQAKCDKLEEENQKLSSTQAALKQAQMDLEDNRKANRDREHTLEMLMMDKAYLSKEVEALSEREKKLEAELDAKAEKVAALKAARQQLYDKLLSADSSEGAKYERRLSEEIARIQAEASSHIDRIRKESTEMFERETRMLRELRDTAQQEASSQASNTKALQTQYDDLLLKHRDLQKRADLKQTELQAEARVRDFELDRLRVLVDEKDTSLKQSTLQAEMLQEKVRVLTENYYTLESEKHRRTADLESQLVACQERLGQYERMENEIDTAVLKGGEDQELKGVLDGALPLAVRRRVQQSLQLAARVSRLEAERLEMAREKEVAQIRCQALENDLAVLKGKTRLLGQPQSYILRQLEDAEKRVRECELKLGQAQTAERQLRQELEHCKADVDEKENKCKSLHEEKEAMKQDLDRVLRERGQLDYMREMLTSAVQAARQQQQQARAGDGGREHIHVGGPSNPPPRKGSPGRSGRGRNAGGQGRRESVRLVGGGTPGNWR